jgi:glycosyltransferase involved in cell wall biosynthesis
VTSKKIIVCVTNDLSHDQRVHKVCTTLLQAGLDITLVGRMLPASTPLTRSYTTKRFKLWFDRGALFYACFNIRLLFYLLQNKADVFHANDLDTLPACYLAGLIKRKKVVYDSHEYFTEVPELVARAAVKKIWMSIEQFIFPKLKYVFTVNQSIADIYRKSYNVDVKVLRNVPFLEQTKKIESAKKKREELSLPSDKKIIILQGAWINVDRGGEEAVQMMSYIDNALLLVVGGGDRYQTLQELTVEKGLQEKIRFYPKLPFEELRQLTMNADLGISLDKGTNLNYLYSLPNKIFDYIHALVPAYVTAMPEVEHVVRTYKVGMIASSVEPSVLAKEINSMLSDELSLAAYKENCLKARNELNWEKESLVLLQVYSKL